MVDSAEAKAEYGITPITDPGEGQYDGVLLAVPHETFKAAGAAALRRFGAADHVFFDLKSVFAADQSDLRL
jgi:UDP-N-acetyl-D-galactosamine dehydrogenase